MASTALATAFLDHEVVSGVLVALRTVGAGELGLHALGATDVLGVRDGFQVFDFYAVSVLAPTVTDMIEFMAVGHRSVYAFPCHDVCVLT